MPKDTARPFAFEDLPLNDEGKRIEPEAWGPKYSKPPKPTRKVDVDRWPSNCASGQKYDFDAAKHRAKLKAEFTARAAADRRAWAEDKSKEKFAAYEACPKWKPRDVNKAAWDARKPHYVLRDGAWRLAA
jgi:hypothetical protein